MKTHLDWDDYDPKQDLDAVLLLHLETEAAVGGSMELPLLDRKPILECIVVLRDGVVIGGCYIEAVAEFVMFGTDPEATAMIKAKTPMLAERLAARGFRGCRTLVPNWIGKDAATICKDLEDVGFRPTDGHYNHYIYKLNGPAQVVPFELETSVAGRCV